MSGKSVKRPKHIPQRTCVGCREVQPKRALLRLVRRPEGVLVDQTGKLSGRGAYLHNVRECWEKGLNGPLAHALKLTLKPDEIDRLRLYMQTLPEDDQASSDK